MRGILCYPSSVKETREYKKFFKGYSDLRDYYGYGSQHKLQDYIRKGLAKIGLEITPSHCTPECKWYRYHCSHEVAHFGARKYRLT